MLGKNEENEEEKTDGARWEEQVEGLFDVEEEEDDEAK